MPARVVTMTASSSQSAVPTYVIALNSEIDQKRLKNIGLTSVKIDGVYLWARERVEGD